MGYIAQGVNRTNYIPEKIMIFLLCEPLVVTEGFMLELVIL